MINIEIKKISEKEIWIGPNKAILLDDGIIHIIANGEQFTELAYAQHEVNLKLAEQIKGKVHYIVDLNSAGKNSPEARKLWKKVSEEKQTGKIGLFGLHPVARVLASFVMSITSSQDMRFFTTFEDALKWVRK